ncbi:MAG: hypothetical protein IJY20_06000 [Clostridia bacterium]|nr:hypothetical protein [Clostridia bacterium]
MNGTIKQLWDGTLCVEKSFYKIDKKHEAYLKMQTCIDHLLQVLPEEQRIDLDNLLRYRDELEQITVEKAFALGYHTGSKITAEALLLK